MTSLKPMGTSLRSLVNSMNPQMTSLVPLVDPSGLKLQASHMGYHISLQPGAQGCKFVVKETIYSNVILKVRDARDTTNVLHRELGRFSRF